MSNEYELALDNRQELIYTKEQLMAPLLPGMEAPPHPMRLGDDEKDYYTVESQAPLQQGAAAERRQRRRPAHHRTAPSRSDGTTDERPPSARCARASLGGRPMSGS